MITDYTNRFGVDLAPTPKNDPKLLAPTRCKVLRRFGLADGKVAEVGQVVELPRHDALSLAAIAKVELLK